MLLTIPLPPPPSFFSVVAALRVTRKTRNPFAASLVSVRALQFRISIEDFNKLSQLGAKQTSHTHTQSSFSLSLSLSLSVSEMPGVIVTSAVLALVLALVAPSCSALQHPPAWALGGEYGASIRHMLTDFRTSSALYLDFPLVRARPVRSISSSSFLLAHPALVLFCFLHRTLALDAGSHRPKVTHLSWPLLH